MSASRDGHVRGWLNGAWGASVVSVVAAGGITVGTLLAAGAPFRESFLAGFLATLAGVLVGVPVAIWLAFHQLSEAGKNAEIAGALRRTQVLAAIREELAENRQTLIDRRMEGEREFYVPFLMDEVWSALSGGGQLEGVDAEVVRRLARAYAFVRMIIYLERSAFDLAHHPNPTRQSSPTGSVLAAQASIDRIRGYLVDQDRVCMDAIAEAFEVLDPILGATAVARTGAPTRPEQRRTHDVCNAVRPTVLPAVTSSGYQPSAAWPGLPGLSSTRSSKVQVAQSQPADILEQRQESSGRS